jgi:hypothetical protein
MGNLFRKQRVYSEDLLYGAQQRTVIAKMMNTVGMCFHEVLAVREAGYE